MKVMMLLHLIGVIIWVGGMFFAHQILRPVAAEQLQPPQRLPLWAGLFRRFFPWVWACIAAIFASGLYMLSLMGGMAGAPWYVHAMLGMGALMAAIFCYVYFVAFAVLRRRVEADDWKGGGEALALIRRLVGINLTLGLATVAIATVGALFA